MADNNIFSQVTESGNYEPISSQSGLDELIAEVNQKQAGGKRRGRPAAKKVSKKSSKKSSRKMSGGKRRKSSKKASKKASKKGSKRQSGGKKRASKKASKKMSKKHSRKSSKKMSNKGGKKSRKSSKKSSRRSSATPKRSLPPAVAEFSKLVKIIANDKDLPVKYPTAMKIAKLYKDDTKGSDPLETTKKCQREYPGESDATKRKYLNKAEKEIADKKSAKKAAKN